jgi:lipopolysaccharide exporter
MLEPTSSKLGREVVIASFYMVGLRMAFRSIGFVSTLILARLLMPDDFGLVGLATAAFSALDLVTDMSMEVALVRLPAIERPHLDTAWTFNLIRGATIAAAIALTANLTAEFTRDPRVVPILWVLAATTFVQSFGNIGMVFYQRELQFDRIFQVQLYNKLVGFCVTVPLAWEFRSYWALVSGIVASRLFSLMQGYVIQSYRPRLSLAAWRELFHFSKWLLATNLLSAIEAYTPTLLFSRIGGPRAVGLYMVASEIGSLPISEIAAPIRGPVYSGYAKLLGNLPELRRHFVASFGLVTLLICPLSVGMGLTADLACRLLLGPDWANATELIRLCAFYALFDSIGHFTHSLYVVLNRQRRLILTMAPLIVIRFGAAIVVGVHWGITATVIVLTITAAISAVIWVACILTLIDLRLGELLRPVWRTVLSCPVMALTVIALVPLQAQGEPYSTVLWRAALAVAVGGTVHIGTLYTLWRLSGSPAGPEAQGLAFVRGIAGSIVNLVSACRAAVFR